MRRFLLLALVTACADPVVDMQLLLPQNAGSFDTSCIAAVEVRVAGTNYVSDQDDYERSCIELTGPANYAAVREAIRGKFDVDVPDSGISGVEIYGWSGPTPCKVSGDDDPYYSPDLLFAGRGDYIGQDRVDIPIVPNLNCAKTQVNVRSVDMLALVGGATCPQAGAPELLGPGSGLGIGTMLPRMAGKGSRFFGNLQGANYVGNLATFTAPTQVGPKACLALDGGDAETSGSTGCAIAGPSVCAGAGEMEHAAMPYKISFSTDNIDATIMTRFPGLIYGSVWANATPRTTLAGATVSVDATHGKVVYVDPPNAQGKLPIRSDQSATGPSGLFMLYTDTLAAVKVTVPGGANRTLTLGAIDNGPAAAMIVVGP